MLLCYPAKKYFLWDEGREVQQLLTQAYQTDRQGLREDMTMSFAHKNNFYVSRTY